MDTDRTGRRGRPQLPLRSWRAVRESQKSFGSQFFCFGFHSGLGKVGLNLVGILD
jgi:hypothetical protein